MNQERFERIISSSYQSVYVDMCIWFSTTNLRETSLKKLNFYDDRVTLTSRVGVNFYMVLDPINNPMKMEYFAQR